MSTAVWTPSIEESTGSCDSGIGWTTEEKRKDGPGLARPFAKNCRFSCRATLCICKIYLKLVLLERGCVEGGILSEYDAFIFVYKDDLQFF